MSTEQKLLKKWRELSPERQQQVLEFVETLSLKTAKNQLSDRPSQSDLGKRLRQIRAKIPIISIYD